MKLNINNFNCIVLRITKDTQRIHEDKKDRHKKHHRSIIGHLSSNAPTFTHLPYFIEVPLNIIEKNKDGI